MDFSFTDEQQAIADLAQQILADHATPRAPARARARRRPRFDRELWGELARGGPARHRGARGARRRRARLPRARARRSSRSAAPRRRCRCSRRPCSARCRSPSSAARRSKQRWLPRVARGEAMLTAALLEDGGDPRAPRPRATRRTAQGWRCAAQALRARPAQIADAILVPAATGGGTVGVFLRRPAGAAASRVDAARDDQRPARVAPRARRRARRRRGRARRPGAAARASSPGWRARATPALCARRARRAARRRSRSPPSTPRRASSSTSRSRCSRPSATAPPTPTSTPRRSGSPRGRRPGGSAEGLPADAEVARRQVLGGRRRPARRARRAAPARRHRRRPRVPAAPLLPVREAARAHARRRHPQLLRLGELLADQAA